MSFSVISFNDGTVSDSDDSSPIVVPDLSLESAAGDRLDPS